MIHTLSPHATILPNILIQFENRWCKGVQNVPLVLSGGTSNLLPRLPHCFWASNHDLLEYDSLKHLLTSAKYEKIV